MIKKHMLNPCPTCGEKDEIQAGQRSPGRYFIECYRCHVSVYDDREEKVQAHWNKIGEKMLEVLKWLDRKGGLGFYVHDKIKSLIDPKKEGEEK